MKEEFDKYVSSYSLDNIKIKKKYDHSCRVMELSRKYAKILGFNDYDVELATLIGLVHDIGRFEQLKVYNTLNDSKSVDHATYGVKVLFEDGVIKRFWDNEEDYDLIAFAVENHNKLEIAETSDERVLKFAKLIRDVDKMDIIYLLGYLHEGVFKGESDDISLEVLDALNNHTSVSWEYKRNENDRIAVYFSYAFDINNKECLGELKENYKYFYEEMKKYSDKFENIYNETIKYIDERMIKC